ncbi:methyl-accepting chemotaxis protein [Alicyclobacillus fastidiosus]|uniref:Methyl-accepting chemotaxis protein n=1 Tax=Alicyclobacillus fastidiosus TaxID=392011 RepID=A0ABV5AK15_9BACL|nr:methyl-accepting chemotaxis protein [Alicyclobacillus fastidiosus]WEH11031.1 methyl-accepting chemotaxis protein [Alicyclobacillus fastidiosus]
MSERKKHIALSSRVTAVFCLLGVLIAGTATTTYVMSTNMNNKVSNVKNEDLIYTIDSQKANLDFMTDDDNMLYLAGIPANTPKATTSAVIAAMNSSQSDLLSSLKSLSKIADLNSRERGHVNTAMVAANAYLALVQKVEQQDAQNHATANHTIFDTSAETTVFTNLQNALNQLTADAKVRVTSDSNEAISYGRQGTLIGMIIGVIAILIGVAGALYTRRALKPLHNVVARLKKVASGDFTDEDMIVSSNDEIADLAKATNLLKNDLSALIANVELHAQQVAASSEQLTASAEQTTEATQNIAQTIQQIAAGSEEQSQSIQASALLVQELSAKMQEIAVSAEQSSTSTSLATTMADEGQKSVSMAIDQMQSIDSTVKSLTAVVKELGDQSTEIGQIVHVIQGIAAQTNLLSLNAAIESARAGEHGKGFAIVANEVRKLAEQSNTSAQRIMALISTIQNRTNDAVLAAEATNREVSTGIESVNSAGDAFRNITDSVNDVANVIREVSNSIQEISTATKMFAVSIEESSAVAATVSNGTQDISATSEEQLASMQEITASSSSLSHLSEELLANVLKFKLSI